jgi:hypothetical protein
MFFRRKIPHESTFAESLEKLKSVGFTVKLIDSRHAQVSRHGIGATVEDQPGQRLQVHRAGLITGDEIGVLVNGGYQMFWKTPTGRRVPAQAAQLKNLHNFEEDLKEGLGLTSLYNESLGTTSEMHLYDRVEHRDEGDEHKPWDRKVVGA